MRVWALASCSGLLALAACSAEQSSSPNPSAPLPEGDVAQVKAQPGLTATASSPVARPEVRPRQGLQSGYRFNPPGTTFSRAQGNGESLPQAAALRDRLQRLRSQQNGRLSPSTPLVNAPQPAALSRPNLPQPTAATGNPAFNLSQGQTFSPQGITPLPQPPQPRPIAPQVAPSSGNTPGFSSAALAPGESVSTARPYPIAPLSHRGYSARPQQQAPVLTVAPAPGEAPSAIARLHGATPITRQAAPASEAASPQVAARQDDPLELTSPELGGSEFGSSAEAVASSNPAPSSPLQAASPGPAAQTTSHRSSGTIALTPAPGPITQSTTDHQSQAVAAATSPVLGQPSGLREPRPETAANAIPSAAIAESLPLHGAAPRPDLVRPQPPLAIDAGSTPAVAPLEEAAIAPPAAVSAGSLPSPGGQSEAAALRGDAIPLSHHQSQLGAETHLIPTSSTPKDLPMAYCLSPSGQLLPTAPETPGSLAALPKFSLPSPDDSGLELSALGKANPVEPCPGSPSPAAEPTDTSLNPG